jgi:hypothetical protein
MSDVDCGHKLCDWDKSSYILVHMTTEKAKLALDAFVVKSMILNFSCQ